MPKFKPTNEAEKKAARAEPQNTEWARAQVSAFFLGFKAQAKGRKG